MEREERRGERIEDQSEQSRADWSKQSRLEQASRNEEIGVERSEQILKERIRAASARYFWENGSGAQRQRRHPQFFEGRRVETWDRQTAACMMMMALEMRRNQTRQ